MGEGFEICPFIDCRNITKITTLSFSASYMKG